MDSHTEKLKKIKEEVINLTASPLYSYRTENHYHPVIGEGDHYAKIIFVGEAPGKNEAEQGRPFCGASGRILDELLAAAAIDRKTVYITNIVKDRPPDNRDPLPAEIDLYSPFLDRQINIIQPKVVATLGRYSMAYIMQRYGLSGELKSISQIHGKVFKTTADYGEFTYIPFYHPAVAAYQFSMRETLKKDFQILREYAK
ncbi:MAG: uracil-DNA glycosylase [Patescibacteria group bacterium]|jgi:DNA polymerase